MKLIFKNSKICLSLACIIFLCHITAGFTQAEITTPALSLEMKYIARGDHYSIGVKNDRTVWSWEENDHGKLGSGRPNISSSFPTQVQTASGPLVVQQFVCKLVSSGLFDFSTSVSC